MDTWTYRQEVADTDVGGFEVEATDGSIGKVDDATYETGDSYLVVDTGPWIFGRKVMLPAGLVRAVDADAEKVYVDRTKDEIEHAPEYDDSLTLDESYRGRLGSYYESEGYREPDYGMGPPEESAM